VSGEQPYVTTGRFEPDKGGPVMDSRPKLTMTVEQAASQLGISRTLAYELVRRGELPHLRLGSRIVVPRRALEALVDGTDQSA
jgi:excisionase family DNA binding protein